MSAYQLAFLMGVFFGAVIQASGSIIFMMVFKRVFK